MPNPLATRIESIRSRIRWLTWQRGLALLVLSVAAAVTVACLVDWIFHVSSELRILFLGAIAGTAAVVGYQFLVAPLRTRIRDLDIALRWEQLHPETKEEISGALGFLEAEKDDPFAGSLAMREHVIESGLSAAQNIEARGLVVTGPAMKATALAAGLFLVVAALGFAAPNVSKQALVRLFDPMGNHPWPKRTQLELVDARSRIAKGEPFPVTVKVGGVIPDRVMLQFKFSDGRTSVSEPMKEVSEGLFSGALETAVLPFSYAVSAGDDRIDWQSVQVVPAPEEFGLKLKVTFPKYTNLPPEDYPEGKGSVRAVIGSSVAVTAQSNKPLAKAEIGFEKVKTPAPARISEDGLSFASEFKISAEDSYRIILVDHEGMTNQDRSPRLHKINAIQDQAPEISLEQPSNDREVTTNAQVPIRAAIKDDFGVASAELVYTVSAPGASVDGKLEEIRIPLAAGEGAPTRLVAETRWDLEKLKVAAGSVITLWVEAKDYLEVPAANVGKSRKIRLRVVTRDEFIAANEGKQQRIREELQRLEQLQENALKQVSDLERQAQSVGKLNPEDRESLSSAETTQRNIRSRVADADQGLMKQVGDLLSDLRNNRITDVESTRRLGFVRGELGRVAEQNLPRISQALAQARKESEPRMGNTADRKASTDSAQSKGGTDSQSDNQKKDGATSSGKSGESQDGKSSQGSQESTGSKDAKASGSQSDSAGKQQSSDQQSNSGKGKESGSQSKSGSPSKAGSKSQAGSKSGSKSGESSQANAGQESQSGSQEGSQSAGEKSSSGQKSGSKSAQASKSGSKAGSQQKSGAGEQQQQSATKSQPASENPPLSNELAQARGDQEKVIESIENMLAQLSEWESLAQASSDARDLLRQQAETANRLAQLAPEVEGKDVEKLEGEKKASLEQTADRQAAVKNNLDKLENLINRLMDRTGEQDAASAEAMKQALEQSKKANLAGKMAQAAQQIRENRVNEAQTNQQEITRGIQEMLEAIENRREAELASLIKQMREAEAQGRSLAEEQRLLRKKTKEAEQIADKGQREEELRRLAKRQQELERKAEEFARRLAKLQAQRAGQRAGRSASRMAQAGQQMQQGQAGEAGEQQQQALQELDDAMQQLARDRREREQQLQQEQLARISDNIRALHERQQGVAAELARLETARQQEGKLSRSKMQSVLGLSRIENGLSGETKSLTEKLPNAKVFGLVLEQAAARMKSAAEKLNQRETGLSVKMDVEGGLRRLTQLLESIAADANQQGGQQGGGQQGGGQGGGEGGGGQGGRDGIPGAAQIKLLISLQSEIQEMTLDMLKAKAKTGKWSPEQEKLFSELSERQGKLADLADDMIREDKNEAPQEMDGDKEGEKR